jgi:hypothetical protein
VLWHAALKDPPLPRTSALILLILSRHRDDVAAINLLPNSTALALTRHAIKLPKMPPRRGIVCSDLGWRNYHERQQRADEDDKLILVEDQRLVCKREQEVRIYSIQSMRQ